MIESFVPSGREEVVGFIAGCMVGLGRLRTQFLALNQILSE